MAQHAFMLILALVVASCVSEPDTSSPASGLNQLPLGVTAPPSRAHSLDSLHLRVLSAGFGEDRFPVIVPGTGWVPPRRFCWLSVVATNVSSTQYFEPVWGHSALVLSAKQDTVFGKVIFWPEATRRLDPGQADTIYLSRQPANDLFAQALPFDSGDTVRLRVLLNDSSGLKTWLDTQPIEYEIFW